MSASTWITDEMRHAIGRQYGEEMTSMPVSASDIRRWALAIYYPDAPPRIFWDVEYASKTHHRGIVAPEEFNPFAWFTSNGPVLPKLNDGARVVGPEIPLGIAAPATSTALNGGRAIEYGARIRPGDVITAGRMRLISYKERVTKLGLTLITETEVVWTNQEHEMVRTTRGTNLRY